MTVGVVQASVSASSVGTDFLTIGNKGFNISVSGTFVGTVKLQRRFGINDTPKDVTVDDVAIAYTAPVEERGEEVESDVQYRLYVSDYTSGTIELRLSY